MEDLVCSFRIDIDIELRCRCPVARISTTAHQIESIDTFSNLRLTVERRSDVGQRTRRDQRHMFRIHHGLHDKINCVLAFGLALWLLHLRTIKSALAMNIICDDKRHRRRTRMSRIDRNIGPADLLQNDQSVAGDIGQITVSADCRHTQQIQIFRCQHDPEGIIVSGIAVQYYFSHSIVLRILSKVYVLS